jgi:myo-inositol 2-dehydrogenase / D-chiro-inositol 1-dehydrogenase
VSDLRVGVLGTGRIGRLHAELLAQRVDGAALEAVYDVNGTAAAEVAARLGTTASAGVDELLARVDAVAICTSTDTHVALIEAAASAGKPIFCEKPIADDLAEVDRALAAVDDADVLFMVGFNRRFDPAHRSVHDAVAAGTVGDVHVLRITSRDPEPPPAAYVRVSGGIFLDMTIHDFDMARYVTGSDVVEVTSRGAVRIDPMFAEADDVDTAVTLLTHANGTFTVIDNSRRAVYGFDQRVEAFGSEGVASSEVAPAHTGVVRTSVGTRRPPLPHFFLERYMQSYVDEWSAFVSAVRDGSGSPVPGRDGRAALATAVAATRSLHERRPVAVADVG